jgi:hypothetical protein
MNGGLTTGFDITEGGLYAIDPDEGEILFVYFTIPPQSVEPWISNSVLEGVGQNLAY